MYLLSVIVPAATSVGRLHGGGPAIEHLKNVAAAPSPTSVAASCARSSRFDSGGRGWPAVCLPLRRCRFARLVAAFRLLRSDRVDMASAVYRVDAS